MGTITSALNAAGSLRRQIAQARREQLKMSHADIANFAKKKTMTANKILKFENNQHFFSPDEIAHLELCLQLPPGFLDDQLSVRPGTS